MSIHHPLGFSWHPLEGAGAYIRGKQHTVTLTSYEVPTNLHRCSSPYISVPRNRGHCDQVLRFHTVRDTSVKVFIAILPTSIIDNWKQNMMHGGSETNETLTRSNISTKGITLLMFEEHLVDTLLGCLFQSSLLPPSTRAFLALPKRKIKATPCKNATDSSHFHAKNQPIHSHYKLSTHPLAIYTPTAVQPTSKKSYGPAFRPLQTNPGRAWGSWGGEAGRGKNATELLSRLSPTDPTELETSWDPAVGSRSNPYNSTFVAGKKSPNYCQ